MQRRALVIKPEFRNGISALAERGHPGCSNVGWTDGWKMFRGSNEAGCCARGRAHSGVDESTPPPSATSEFELTVLLDESGVP